MKNTRPVLQIPKTTLEKWHDVLGILILLSMMGYIAIVWPQLPEKFAAHINAAGEVDGWGGKGGLLPLPIIGVVLYVGLTMVSKIPHTFNYLREITPENAPRQYLLARLMVSWLKVLVVALFAFLEFEVVQLAFGRPMQMWLLPIFLVLMGVTMFTLVAKSLRK